MRPVRSVCVYCGSSKAVPTEYLDAARQMGRTLAENGIRVIYGGGRVGLMGLVADSALEAGGEVVGIIPEHIQVLEVEHLGLTELLVVDSMHTRKQLMFERSDAFVILPGGLGTLDETFEIITWKQLRLHDRPVILVNIGGYWDPLLSMIDRAIDTGFCRPAHRTLFDVVDRVDDVLEALGRAPAPAIDPRSKWL